VNSPNSTPPPPLQADDVKFALRKLTQKFKRLRTLTRKQKIQKAKRTCPNYGAKIRKTRANIMRASKNLVQYAKDAGSPFLV
jgi:hypothetical protein